MTDGGAIVAEANLRVRLFDSSGKFVRAFGSRGSGPGEFMTPMSLARDDSGRVFVQRMPRGVNVYDSLGRAIETWSHPAASGFSLSGQALPVDTAGFVTDGANETYTKALDVYPVTRGGVTFGADENLSSADRDAGVDRERALARLI